MSTHPVDPPPSDARDSPAQSGSCWLPALGHAIWKAPSALLIALVRVYQWTLSPIIGRQCRFQPTCSHYFIGAVQKYGAVSGTIRGILRICRCHPWHPGGYDPP